VRGTKIQVSPPPQKKRKRKKEERKKKREKKSDGHGSESNTVTSVTEVLKNSE
jgi:hypothetical protein